MKSFSLLCVLLALSVPVGCQRAPTNEVCVIPTTFNVGDTVAFPDQTVGVIIGLDRMECGKAYYRVEVGNVCKIVDSAELVLVYAS